MVTGRITRVQATTKPQGTGRITKLSAVTDQAADVGRITKVSAVAIGNNPINLAAAPYDVVDLGPGTWVQTSGPAVTTPTFTAPAARTGATLTFTNSGSTATVTVNPHTMFRLTSAGLDAFRFVNL